MKDGTGLFESRKQDHLRLALDPRTQTEGQSKLDRVQLVHEALPDLNLEEIDLKTDYWGTPARVPLFISSMTAGHVDSVSLNVRLAKFSAERGWAMGVGSQRRELSDVAARDEWKNVRREAPGAILFGNLGIAQVITSKVSDIQALVENLEAKALFVHLNPLQECLQPEGTPQFRGGLEKLAVLCRELSVPVLVKEVGCGISETTARRLGELGIGAVDVAGLGGTHWGRLEGFRAPEGSPQASAATSFADWGLSTVESLLEVKSLHLACEVWASGGVRTGLDAAKLIALGADKVGLAQPVLRAALESEERLRKEMERIEFELKVALFCTGSRNPNELRGGRRWRWK